MLRTGVANGGNVLDHDEVVRVLALFDGLTSLAREILRRLEEHVVGSNHIVNLG